MSTDLFDTPLVTRSDAFVASAAAVQPVIVRPCHAGIDVQDDKIGLWALPQADGRLGFQVIGLPARTGFDGDCSLLQSDARHDYAPGDVRIDGSRLVCLRPNETEPLLQEGFVLSLSPAMAAVLTAWLPRLVHVAERAHQVAIAVAAHLAPAYSDNGIDVCAALVSRIMLDGHNVEDARRIVGDVHWTLERPDWRAAVDAPDVRALLQAAATEVAGAAVQP